jgi:uncharacterized protein (DUF486 family)
MQIPVIFQTTGLLILSNVFMTFAWYGHLKNLSNKAWYVAALISWGIALFEYRRYTQVRLKWTCCSPLKSTT